MIWNAILRSNKKNVDKVRCVTSLAATGALIILLGACAAIREPAPTSETGATAISPPATDTLPVPSSTPAAPTPTNTPLPVLVPPTASSTAAPTATASPERPTGTDPQAIVVDHVSLERFSSIPDEYIEAAAGLRLLVRHASVGQIMNEGLDCLMDDSGDHPFYCDRELPSEWVIHDGKYDRSNWRFEPHATPNPNPGWQNKANFFIARADEVQVNQNYDAMLMLLAYLDGAPGSNIDDLFFSRSEEGPVGVEDLEALQQRHPNTRMIWTTLALARVIGGEDSARYNEQLREYIRTHGGYLLDLADIESHAPDGSLCVDDGGYPVICPHYTRESEGGHPNALGSQRIARGLWLVMAHIAGWQGN